MAPIAPENGSQSSPALTEARPQVELPGEKPMGETLPEVSFAEPVVPVAPKASKPASPANISSTAPTVAFATDDNESFPL